MSGLWNATKHTASRATHSLKVAVGKADVAVDGPYDEAVASFKIKNEAAQKLKKNTKKLAESIKDFGTYLVQCAEDYGALVDDSESTQSQLSRCLELVKAIDAARVQLDEQLRRGVVDPLSNYLIRFDSVESRIKAAKKLREDVDRYNMELKSLKSKNPNDQKIIQVQAKSDTANSTYLTYRDPLIEEITAIMADTQFFVDSIAAYMSALGEYFQLAARTTQELNVEIRHRSDSAPSITRSGSSVDHYVAPPITRSGSSADHYAAPTPAAQTYVPATTSSGGTAYVPAFGAPSQPSRIAPVQPAGPPRANLVIPPTTAVSNTQISPRGSNPQISPRGSGPFGAHMPPAPARPGPPPLPKRGPTARAKFDFEASEAGELSFRTGDVISIHSQDGDWWDGELNGQKGKVPSNYIQLI